MSTNFLHETLADASKELCSRFGGRIATREKKDTSLVTDADLASEKIILDRIRKYFPDDTIYSEEAGLSSKGRTPGKYIWIIDPLDGTTNYSNGYPFFCVSIGRGRFRDDGTIEMVLGGIADPTREKLYIGELGKGAFCGDRKLQVSAGPELKKSFLVTGFYYSKGRELEAEVEKFHRAAEVCSSIRRDGAAALDLALVAEGIFDGFWEKGLQPWDVAAGSVLISEAGGVVRNYQQLPKTRYNVEDNTIVVGSESTVGQLERLFWS